MPELTPRQQLILSLVVRQYTRSAVPVGSKSLVSRQGLDVSSATIRNELALLEELGLLTHPHTSAGRVPTDLGYRYFIENLMPERSLPLAVRRRIRHQFHQLGLEMDQWLQLSAAVLADTVRSAALVTAPKAPQVRFKHLELISTYGNALLLVLVFQDGAVRQQGLFTREPVSQEVLSNIASRLTSICRGLLAEEILSIDSDLTEFEAEVLKLVGNCMQDSERYAAVEAYHEGFRHLLNQPEFHDSTSISQAMTLLEGDWLKASVLPEVFGADGITVIVGGEHKEVNLGDYGLVLSRYGVRHQLVGALGVLGPIRMQYERVIPTVRYMASLLSDLVSNLFGPEDSWYPPEPSSKPEGSGDQRGEQV